MSMPRANFLLFIAASCLSGPAISGAGSPHHATQAWVGTICTETTRSKDKLFVVADKLFGNAAKLCVDTAAPILDYKPNSLRVETIKKIDVTGLRLKCASEDDGKNFFRINAGKDVAFIVGGRVLGIYRAEQPNMGCGWHEASGLDVAREQCKAIARAWGNDARKCSAPCADSGSQDICVTGG
jgi:hypothetical protein